MKILISETEFYNIEFPESISLQELGLFIEKLLLIRKLARDPILDNDFSSINKRTRFRTKGLFSVITDRNQAIEFIRRYRKGDMEYISSIYHKFGREFIKKEMSNEIWRIKKRFTLKDEDIINN